VQNSKVVRRRSLERFQIEPQNRTPPRGPANKSEHQTPQSQHKSNDISHRFTRPDLFDDYNAPRRARGVPDTRYFHIRSWNHENVRSAQQDCTWVTQKTNEHVFIEAFEQSRRVILFFSVNNSKSFQGIAQMGSVPGQSCTRGGPPALSKCDGYSLVICFQVLQDFPILLGNKSFTGHPPRLLRLYGC
jgi:YT521-B-like domain